MSEKLRINDGMEQALDHHLSMIPIRFGGTLHWQSGLGMIDETVLLTLALNEESVRQGVGFFWVDTKDESNHGTWFYQAKKWRAAEKAEYFGMSNLKRYHCAAAPFGPRDLPIGKAIPVSRDPADDCRQEYYLTRESLIFAHALSSFILVFSVGRPYLFATHRLQKECSHSNSLTNMKDISSCSMASFCEFLYGYDKFIEEVLTEQPTAEQRAQAIRELVGDTDSDDDEVQQREAADVKKDKDSEMRVDSAPVAVLESENVAEPIHDPEAQDQIEATEEFKIEEETAADTLPDLGALVLTESEALRSSCASFRARRESLKHKRQPSGIVTDSMVASDEVDDLPSLSRMASASSKSDSIYPKRPATLSRMESFQSATSPAGNRASTYSVAASIQGSGEAPSLRRASTYSVPTSWHSASSSIHGRSTSTLALDDSFYSPWDDIATGLHLSPVDNDTSSAVMRTYVTFDELVEDSAKVDLADVCKYLAEVFNDPVIGEEYSVSWKELRDNLREAQKPEEEGEL